MRRIVTIAIALGFLVGAQAIAQEKTRTETTTKQSAPGPDLKTKTETVTGTVKEYEPGKKIKLSGPGDKTYSFDLDEPEMQVKVQGGIVIGQMAKVTYRKGTDGREHVTVISEVTGKEAGMAAPSTAPKVHSESTMKHTGPGPDTKMKTEVVIGTVKEYEPGKKIKVTGPKNKDFSFDLDENAGVQGSFAVGDRVKVTYTKTDSGDKVTTVAPYKGRS
ncbi:MAG TPA: hypothetical protein VGL03_13705 [Thermoanaerobaculia bacterium]|jgi:hypothetical protein